MERKINWYSGCHDEIELVYSKAEGNENIAAALMEHSMLCSQRQHLSSEFLLEQKRV